MVLFQVYWYENGDGTGRASDLVLQGFTRFVTWAITPVVVCAALLYLLVRPNNVGVILNRGVLKMLFCVK